MSTVNNPLIVFGIGTHADMDVTKSLELTKYIKNLFTIENPQWHINQRMNHWNGKIPRYLTFYEQRGIYLMFPRGAINVIAGKCIELGLQYTVNFHTSICPPERFKFEHNILRTYQLDAVHSLTMQNFGVLQAPTGSGKTVIALAMIAARRQPTLILVHTKELLYQWLARIETFLGSLSIGVVGDQKYTLGKNITVGIVNSVHTKIPDLKGKFGHIIVDECHRVPARTFTDIVTAFDCRYMLGLSATAFRRDGLTPLIEWYLGPKTTIKPEELSDMDIVKDIRVVVRPTEFETGVNVQENYSKALTELTEDGARNRLITDDIIQEVKNNSTCLVLSDRKEHCSRLFDLLDEQGLTLNTGILTGKTPDKIRQETIARLNAGQIKILIATSQLAGEGLDIKSLSALFLTTPVKFNGRLIQYLGRILRCSDGKKCATVYDYVDSRVGVFKAAGYTRLTTYKKIGAKFYH